jgi:hypothetical protein
MNKLRFYLNKELDERIAEEFLNIQRGGIDFGEGIIKIHPKLKLAWSLKDNSQRKKFIHTYFDNYYQTHKIEMLRKIESVRKAWRKQENEYITITEDFFDGFRFPKGKYIAYASIINCNPRFLESKTFQFFYKKPLADIIYTIGHELLHFIFFDFLKKNFKKEIKALSKNQLWDLSEIFNVIVLKSSRYRHIINQKFIIPYPNHRYHLRQFEKIYKKFPNAKEFIGYSIPIIKNIYKKRGH